ncbi:MAG TPA: hypothetical protein VLE49_05570 [Anaerolineales bacterium]|nr:hypothetical protein [Anaerolineales bacterium]
MPDWKRATKEIPFEALSSEMIAAINKHIEQYNLDSLLSDALLCIQTDSEKFKDVVVNTAQAPEFGSLND